MKIIRAKLWERKSIEIDQNLFRNNKLFGAYGKEVVLDMKAEPNVTDLFILNLNLLSFSIINF